MTNRELTKREIAQREQIFLREPRRDRRRCGKAGQTASRERSPRTSRSPPDRFTPENFAPENFAPETSLLTALLLRSAPTESLPVPLKRRAVCIRSRSRVSPSSRRVRIPPRGTIDRSRGRRRSPEGAIGVSVRPTNHAATRIGRQSASGRGCAADAGRRPRYREHASSP